MKNNKSFSAFTLLEMLVVIGIIAVLIGIGSVSYSTAQKKSRDAKRKTDLKNIQNALEQYYSICGYTYPTPVNSKVPNPIVCTNPNTTIMSNVPTDPKTGVSYSMTQSSTSDYTICAPNDPPLESENVSLYCLTNQQ